MARLGRILKLMKQLSTALTWRILLRDSNKPVIWGTMIWYCPAWSARHAIAPQVATQDVRQKGPWPRSYQKGWMEAFGKEALKDRCVILHTDAAKSYRLRMPGVLHDHVRHCKKRQKIKGKWVWKAPTYVKMSVRKDPKTGCQIKTKGGAQIVDCAWRYLKERIKLNQNCAVGSPLMRCKGPQCPVLGIATRIFGLHLALCVPGTLAKIIAWLQAMKYAGKKSACACLCASLEFFPATHPSSTMINQHSMQPHMYNENLPSACKPSSRSPINTHL